MTSNETGREARRVLRHLGASVLEPRAGRFVLAQRRGGKARLTVSAEGVTAMAAEGWIARTPEGCFALTAQGRAFVARDGAAADPFRAQHGDIIALKGEPVRDGAASVLDWLGRVSDARGRPYLGPQEREAAARLEADFEAAHFRPRLTLDVSVPVRGTPVDGDAPERLSGAALDARRRVMAALDAAGPGIKDMLFETVCLSHGLTVTEQRLGWPRRAGKALLRMGLQRLAEHYGLTSGARRPGRIEAWMAAAEAVSPPGA
ncbi:MAG: DUF6456 domain-containing protein [Micropepsaceae bacterium]